LAEGATDVSVSPKLVVGLGNPGAEYVGTRHNIGFAVLDRLAAKLECSFRSRSRFAALVAEAARGPVRLVLAKPQTFMNRSGESVGAILRWMKLAPGEMLVVVDDADLPLGQIRLRLAGGSGGHNGMRSILETLGGDEGFPRLRIGIGRSGPVGRDITGHVLGRFAAAEKGAVEKTVDLAVEAVLRCVDDGLTAAMNQFNRKQVSEGKPDEGERK
jgi:PTH1 family peptidyl-tRNA hydrolase